TAIGSAGAARTLHSQSSTPGLTRGPAMPPRCKGAVLTPGIRCQTADGRVKPGHDEVNRHHGLRGRGSIPLDSGNKCRNDIEAFASIRPTHHPSPRYSLPGPSAAPAKTANGDWFSRF